jgi:hypothetical protein
MQQQVHLVMLQLLLLLLLLLRVVMQQVTGPTETVQLLMGLSVLHPAVLQG